MEVTCIVNCSIVTTCIVGVGLNIVESERLIGISGHFFVTSVYSDARLSITTVINTDINSILGIWFQASQFLSETNFFFVSLNTKHIVCPLRLDNFCLRSIA